MYEILFPLLSCQSIAAVSFSTPGLGWKESHLDSLEIRERDEVIFSATAVKTYWRAEMLSNKFSFEGWLGPLREQASQTLSRWSSSVDSKSEVESDKGTRLPVAHPSSPQSQPLQRHNSFGSNSVSKGAGRRVTQLRERKSSLLRTGSNGSLLDERSHERQMSRDESFSSTEPVEEDGDDKIFSSSYYAEFSGHPLEDLAKMLRRCRRRPGFDGESRNAIFLAGDSTLDNKYYIRKEAKPVNGYEQVLDDKAHRDVCHCINQELVNHRLGEQWFAINAAVENCTLRSKASSLNQHDEFVRDNVTEDDMIVVSLGGNDLALSPTLRTLWHMMVLMYVNKASTTRNGSTRAMKHLCHIFRDGMQDYLEKLTSKRKPKKIVLCFLYFPHENTKKHSWANTKLAMLGYNTAPYKAQSAFHALFDLAIKQVQLPGVQLVPHALFNVLDSSDPSRDYVERVQPSEQGGTKMAESFLSAAGLI